MLGLSKCWDCLNAGIIKFCEHCVNPANPISHPSQVIMRSHNHLTRVCGPLRLYNLVPSRGIPARRSEAVAGNPRPIQLLAHVPRLPSPVPPRGFEPLSWAPEAHALSTELWGLRPWRAGIHPDAFWGRGPDFYVGIERRGR